VQELIGQVFVLLVTSIVTLLFARTADIRFAVVASIVRSIGSRSQVPALPLVALVLMLAVGARLTAPLELVSIKPPLPDKDPPIDLRMPATVVFTSDQIAMAPPLPVLVDEVSIKAFSSMMTVWANCLFRAAWFALALIPAWVGVFTWLPPDTWVFARPILT
jgi:hypothetical protein